MRIITATNRKGGVGKTSLLQVFAPYLTYKLGKKVLIMDLDEQANLSCRYLKMRKTEFGDYLPPTHPDTNEIIETEPDFKGHSASTDIFTGEPLYAYETALDGLQIYPADTNTISRLKRTKDNTEIEAHLYNFFNLEEVQEQGWDVVLIDTPPDMNSLTLSAVRASTHVIIPAVMEPKSIEGLVGVISKVRAQNSEKPANRATKIAGILPSLFDKTVPIHKQYLNEIKKNEFLKDLVIDVPMYKRTDILRLDTAKDELSAVSPFDPSRTPARVRKECIAWCEVLASRIGLTDETTAA